MYKTASISREAPDLLISKWAQGEETNISKLRGNVIVLEFFQLNCPGCFSYALPEVINIYNKFTSKGFPLVVLGISTAFEDFDKNNFENLEKLLTKGEVVGETFSLLYQAKLLKNGNEYPHKIPFPVAMDLIEITGGKEPSDEEIMKIIKETIPGGIEQFYKTYKPEHQQIVILRIREYLKSKKFEPKSFGMYKLQGTPSTVLIDKEGILRKVLIGQQPEGYLESEIEKLLH